MRTRHSTVLSESSKANAAFSSDYQFLLTSLTPALKHDGSRARQEHRAAPLGQGRGCRALGKRYGEQQPEAVLPGRGEFSH